VHYGMRHAPAVQCTCYILGLINIILCIEVIYNLNIIGCLIPCCLDVVLYCMSMYGSVL